MKRLTRQALVLIYAIIIVVFIAGAFIVFKPAQPNGDIKKEAEYSIVVVAENQKLASTYIDSISKEKSSSEYKEYRMTLQAGTQVGDYILSQQQMFSKYIQPLGPDKDELVIKGSKYKITHYAYSMLLVGDVVEKTNLSTKEKVYEIVNARITYDQIPLSLLSEEDSVVLANAKKDQEKIVNLQEFVNALKNVQKRNEMISW